MRYAMRNRTVGHLAREAVPCRVQNDARPKPRHRIDYVDGLRAVAVFTVLVSHIALHAPLSGMPYHALMEGAHGVDLFFVISGFCLAFPTLAKIRASRADVAFDVTDFGAKRLVRIIPPFYIATAVLLAFVILPHLAMHRTLPDGLPSARSLGASLLFLDDNVQLLNGSFWTLMVEFRWYFVFPFMLWLWIVSPRAFLAAGIASIVLYHLTRARGLDFGTLPGFMLGIVAADVQLAGVRTAGFGPQLRRWAWALIVPAALAGIAYERGATIPGFNRADVAFAYQPTILGWQIACFALVVAAGASATIGALLSLRALVVTGIASYGIYLVHEPVIAFVVAHVHGVTGQVFAGAAALAAGFMFWSLAEIPFTTGPLRAPLLAALRPLVARGLAMCGIRGTIMLSPMPHVHRIETRTLPDVANAVSQQSRP